MEIALQKAFDYIKTPISKFSDRPLIFLFIPPKIKILQPPWVLVMQVRQVSSKSNMTLTVD